MPAWAALLPDAEVARVDRLMARKYRVDLLFIEPFRTVQAPCTVAGPRDTGWPGDHAVVTTGGNRVLAG